MSEAVHVFVGASPHGMDLESEAVLEYSVRRHASLPVDITWMRASDDPDSPWSGWERTHWATPFSGFRWAVAHVARSLGLPRAIYTDNDVLFLGDIAELWHMDFAGRPIIARGPGRLCVSVWDTETAPDILWPLDRMRSDPQAHQRMSSLIGADQITPLDPAWNCLDGEDVPLEAIKGLHFTDMSTQPAAELADARLRSRGQRTVSAAPRRHWYQGKRRDHRRPDCVDLFHRYYGEASRSRVPGAESRPLEKPGRPGALPELFSPQSEWGLAPFAQLR